MDKNTNSQELVELKAKLSIYEQWQNDKTHYSNFNEDDISLKELWHVVSQGKWKIIAITVVFFVISVFYALSLPNIYKSEALLMPNSQESQQSGLGTIAGQFGGLASLAGINLGSNGTDKTSYALEVLKSREFLYKFIEDNDLKAALMAAKGWDSESNTLIFDNDVYDASNGGWERKVKSPFKKEPSLQETYKEFLDNALFVSQDLESGMIKVSVSHFSPLLAKQLVEKLIESLNQTIKIQDMKDAMKSIEYFEKELNNTAVAGAQSMFYQLIEQQQQTLMLTKVRDDYVLKVVDKAIVPEKKDKPRRTLICILGSLVGAIFATIAVLFFGLKKLIRTK